MVPICSVLFCVLFLFLLLLDFPFTLCYNINIGLSEIKRKGGVTHEEYSRRKSDCCKLGGFLQLASQNLPKG